MRTKAEILTAKRDAIAAELHRANREIDGLQHTDSGLNCGGCGKHLATEWDFASHFLIPDERFLNLGGCPVVDRPTRPLMRVHFEFKTVLGG